MKLVFVITDLRTGGAEIMLLRLLERLDRKRFQPHVISLVSLSSIGSHVQALGIPVEALGMQPGRIGLLAFVRLIRRLRALRPDLVQTWMYHADLVGGLAARMAGVPAVVWGIRNGSLHRAQTKLATRLVVGACARLSGHVPHRIISCAKTACELHAALGYPAGRMLVIPNGFDLDQYSPDTAARDAIRTELGLVPDTPLVGLVGRFDPQKNYAGFIQAAGLLHMRQPQVHFLMAGQGVERDNRMLAKAIDAAGLGSGVSLLGQRDDMPRLMAALDLLVSASAYGEAFPNVLGEAMACAVPCVTTDIGDAAYIVGDTGKVVAPGDSAALAAAMEQVLAMPAAARTELGHRARARIAAHFEIGEVTLRYEALYEALGG
jgi:glycosyltransferase involved in cell wall biosynthesis